jgi:hypothetical protein
VKTSTKVGSLLGGSATIASLALGLVTPEMVKEFLGEALQYQVTSFTIAFILAWKIVKRDMRKDNDGLVQAVNRVSTELHYLNENNLKRFAEQDEKIEQLQIDFLDFKQAKA